MNTSVTQCHRCGGQGGAHFASCFFARLWERVMGPGFPWSPPSRPLDAELEDRLRTIEKSIDEIADAQFEEKRGRRQSELLCMHDIPLSEPCFDCLPVPDGDDSYWEHEAPEEPALPAELDGLPPRPPEPTGWPGDPPDPQGVMEDFLVIAGHVESDAEWLPYGQTSISLAAHTELPEGYLDQKVDELAAERRRRAAPVLEAARKRLEAQEDAAVQFVYDCTDTVPGGRVRLDRLHERYVEWHQVNDRPYISKGKLRSLLGEMGLGAAPGRLPGGSELGRPPILVHGIALREEPAPEPEVSTVRVLAKQRERHALIGAKPGPELPKQVRELIEPLVTEQGWAYSPCNANGRGKPRLTKGNVTVTLPNSPHLRGRTLENTRSYLKQHGALL